jgi:murein DD-endopeptidase MepM/ murein hydrolase activator NlpD
MVTEALSETALQRDALALEVAEVEDHAEEVMLAARLQQDRTDKIFTQLEDALTISVAPLDNMFRKAGLSTDSLIDSVRRGYSGQGGPLTPITFSSRGEGSDPYGDRANTILQKLDRMNLYRIAAEKAPFDIPVKGAFRFTSGFGPRWGRMHNGTDFAAATGTPIYATADGVVIHASSQSGYGRLVKIQHEFGIETRYAHLSKIRVKVGQRVSRGDRIGDMGNSGRSTGTHLHYEVRVGGKAVNPMTYIKAGKDVF